jgi:hypothetical protein
VHSSGDIDWHVLFQSVSLLGFHVNHSGDTDLACLVSGGELAWFLMCTPLVTETVAIFFLQKVSWPGF